jgi:hypothetical protein
MVGRGTIAFRPGQGPGVIPRSDGSRPQLRLRRTTTTSPPATPNQNMPPQNMGGRNKQNWWSRFKARRAAKKQQASQQNQNQNNPQQNNQQQRPSFGARAAIAASAIGAGAGALIGGALRGNGRRDDPGIWPLLFFFIAIAMHLTDAFYLRFSRSGETLMIVSVLYAFLTIFSFFLLFKNRLEGTSAFTVPFFTSVFAVLSPIFLEPLLSQVDKIMPNNLNIGTMVSGFLTFFPAWPLMIGSYFERDSRLIRWVTTLYISAWIIFFTWYGITYLTDNSDTLQYFSNMQNYVDVYKPLIWLKTESVYLWNKFVKAVIDLPDKIRDINEKMKAEAMGEYYTGTIDQNAKERLGVYIDEVNSLGTTLYVDRPFTLWANLIAKTIDEPININLRCSKDGKASSKGTVYPPSPIIVESSEQTGIECTYSKTSLSEGDYELGFIADFNFATSAYIKTYFMDTENKRALVSENIDPLDHYGITDKEPGAIYTSGPVQIGLNVGKPPLLTDKQVRLAISLSNNWEGKIKGVNDLYIVVPKQLKMTNKKSDGSGYICNGKHSYLFEEVSCTDVGEDVKGCDDSKLHNVFKLKDTSEKMKDIENFETVLCWFDIGSRSDLLGNLPITTKYFKVVTKYNYSVVKEIGINVEEGDGEKTYFMDNECLISCTDKDGCVCPDTCDTSGEISEASDCDGTLVDRIRKDLNNCTEVCDDNDGCTCVVSANCVKQGYIDIRADCGDINTVAETASIDASSASGCSGDYTARCGECNKPEQPGVYCYNNQLACTTEANAGNSTYQRCPT